MSIPQKIAYKEQEIASNALMSKDPAIVSNALRHIQTATQNGTIPAYVGVPLVGPLAQHFKQLQAMQAMPAAQMPGAAGPQPTIAEQTMAEAQGIEQAQSNLPETYADGGILNFQPQNTDDSEHEYAGGGMIAFAGKQGSLVDDDDTEDEDDYEDRVRAAEMADFENQAEHAMAMNDYLASKTPAASSSTEGISAINLTPAASKGFGINTNAPSGTGIRSEAKAPRGIEALEARVLRQESNGRRYDKEGKLLTSSKGAEGEMQVMPATQRDPGFGVKPAKDNSPEEKARVGRDYLRALYNRYGGDEQLTLMAYNWGPGNVDKYLKAGRDIAMVPAETRKYASLAKGGIAQLPTKHYVLGDVVMSDFGDPMGADPRAATNVDEFGRTVEEAARDAKRTTKIGKPPTKEAAEVLEKLKSNAARQAAANAPKVPKAPPTTLGEDIVKGIRSLPRPSFLGVTAPTAALAGGIGSTAYSGNIASNPAFQELYQSDPGSDAAIAGQIQAQANKSKPIASWIPDWLLPADLVERRNIEQGIKKPAAAPTAPAAAPAAPQADLPPAAVQDPNNPTNYVETNDPFEGNPMLKEAYEWYKTKKEGLASQAEQDKWMSILAAGLGMMGGTSPYAAANIGQGATQGIQTMLAANKLRNRQETSLGDFASKLGLGHEAAMARKERVNQALESKYEQDVGKVNAKRVDKKNELLKTPEYLNVGMMKDTVAKRLAEADMKGKKRDPKDVAEYDRLNKKLQDLDDKIAKDLPHPSPQRYGIKGDIIKLG